MTKLHHVRNSKVARPTPWIAGALAGSLLACSAEPVGTEGETSSAILEGSAADWSGARATVYLGGCSAVLLNATTLATAEHCMPTTQVGDEARRVDTVSLAVRGGSDAGQCLTGDAPGAGCAKQLFRVVQQPASDLVLLVARQPLRGGAFAHVALGIQAGAAVRVQGFGEGTLADARASVAAGTRNLGARQAILQVDDRQLYGLAPAGGGVCGGDSGGPAFLDGDAPVVAGVLSASASDADHPSCTAARGLQRWTRIDPAFVRDVAGPCAEATVASGVRALDCSAGGGRWYAAPRDLGQTVVSAAPVAAAAAVAAVAAVAALGADDDPELAPLLARGGRIVASPTGAERGTVVGAVTARGRYTLVLDDAQAQLLAGPRGPAAADGGGERGDASRLAVRGNSNGVDNRDEFLVKEAGAVRGSSSTTGGPGCTGALIGRRLVRTAAHCLSTNNYFTARYNGGVTTWTFDGGATYVTFNPVLAQGYYYGGNYYNYNCDDSAIRYSTKANSEKCAAQDWAILILPQNAWAPVNVVPKYMGYTSPSVGAVANTGYPSCSDVSSALITTCVNGRMYGESCSIVVNDTTLFYSSCDSSPGHSGGPTFTTSGSSNIHVGHIVANAGNIACDNAVCPTQHTGTGSWLLDFQSQLRSQYDAVDL